MSNFDRDRKAWLKEEKARLAAAGKQASASRKAMVAECRRVLPAATDAAERAHVLFMEAQFLKSADVGGPAELWAIRDRTYKAMRAAAGEVDKLLNHYGPSVVDEARRSGR